MERSPVRRAALFLLAIPSTAAAQLAGTAHDLSGEYAPTIDEMCVFCHTPHNSDQSLPDAQLWNHELTTGDFTLYSSRTLTATPSQPTGSSMMCLSCHDGTIAIDAFGGSSGTTNMGTQFAGSVAIIGLDLSDDHPVSFVYDSALAAADGELFDPAIRTTPLGGTIESDLLFAGSLECASCHDVHSNVIAPFLRISDSRSQLCLTCHNK